MTTMTVRELSPAKSEPRYIAVEGPIGVGKTSLARRLAKSFGGDLVLEQTEENPFLEEFYRSGRRTALPAQLHFLFQRSRQLEALNQGDLFAPIRIADFHMLKDQLFAEINLDPDELALYRQVYDKLEIEIPVPDLVIYLQASVDALMSRVASRGVDYEKLLDRTYLERVADTYAKFFYDYDDSPLLIVNASSINPVQNDLDYESLYRQVRRITSGRHFFNPAAAVAFA